MAITGALLANIVLHGRHYVVSTDHVALFYRACWSVYLVILGFICMWLIACMISKCGVCTLYWLEYGAVHDNYFQIIFVLL